MFKKKSGQRGFTLIELLVVIAIIGILSSVVLVSLNSARVKARDAKRVSDIASIQQALALYYDSNGAYPTDLHTLVTSKFLPSDPVGPNSGENYFYTPSKNDSPANLSYHLGANLEGVAVGQGVLASDKNCDSSAAGGCFTAAVTLVAAQTPTTPGGFKGANVLGTPCSGTAVAGSSLVCYDVTP